MSKELHDSVHHNYERSFSIKLAPGRDHKLPDKITVYKTAEGLPW